MIVYAVHVYVKEGGIKQFLEATEKNHRGTRKEPGNLRFDVLQMDEDRSTFLLYEVYRDTGAQAAHRETAHYKEWREAVAPLMARPREGVKYIPHFPEADGEW